MVPASSIPRWLWQQKRYLSEGSKKTFGTGQVTQATIPHGPLSRSAGAAAAVKKTAAARTAGCRSLSCSRLFRCPCRFTGRAARLGRFRPRIDLPRLRQRRKGHPQRVRLRRFRERAGQRFRVLNPLLGHVRSPPPLRCLTVWRSGGRFMHVRRRQSPAPDNRRVFSPGRRRFQKSGTGP